MQDNHRLPPIIKAHTEQAGDFLREPHHHTDGHLTMYLPKRNRYFAALPGPLPLASRGPSHTVNGGRSQSEIALRQALRDVQRLTLELRMLKSQALVRPGTAQEVQSKAMDIDDKAIFLLVKQQVESRTGQGMFIGSNLCPNAIPFINLRESNRLVMFFFQSH